MHVFEIGVFDQLKKCLGDAGGIFAWVFFAEREQEAFALKRIRQIGWGCGRVDADWDHGDAICWNIKMTDQVLLGCIGDREQIGGLLDLAAGVDPGMPISRMTAEPSGFDQEGDVVDEETVGDVWFADEAEVEEEEMCRPFGKLRVFNFFCRKLIKAHETRHR